MSINILVLAHGRVFTPRCSPIDLNEWYEQPYLCVDIDPDLQPDIIADLKETPWAKIEGSYDIIIDCGGLALDFMYGKNNGKLRFIKHQYDKEIDRLLKPNGKFYARTNFIYVKSS